MASGLPNLLTREMLSSRKDAAMNRSSAAHRAITLVLALTVSAVVTACGEDAGPATGASSPPGSATSPEEVDRLVALDDGRKIHLRCSGTGSPTVVLEGGDDDAIDSYAYAESALSSTTRTCGYDRANLGSSDPDPRCRGFDEVVGDLEQVLDRADEPGPYVLVGTSGGGFIVAGYAERHPSAVAGLVFIETPPPWADPPADLVAETRCTAPGNIENRDYLGIERAAWAARRPLGSVPVTVISNRYSADEVAGVQPLERPLLRHNVSLQRGWLVLSTQARQVVVRGGHDVETDNADLVVREILAVLDLARGD